MEESIVEQSPQENGSYESHGLATALSTAVVKAYVDYLGRGPTKARAVLGGNLASVLLEDTLTKAERRLVEAGRGEDVVRNRRILQQTMRDELCERVEEILGRRVIAFLSDHQPTPDYAVETFVLETKA